MKRADVERAADEELYLAYRQKEIAPGKLYDKFELFDADLRTVGEVHTRPPLKGSLHDERCRAAEARLRSRFPEIVGTKVVDYSLVAPSRQGRGYGKMLYDASLREAAREGYALAPDRCDRGETSADAQRVWKSLVREYPHEGYVIWGQS